METCADPAAVPLDASVKFTLVGLAEIVSDSGKVALRFTVAELELTCASVVAAQPIAASIKANAARVACFRHRSTFWRT
jgi:hypothetical protein